jgi:hypothetical protein
MRCQDNPRVCLVRPSFCRSRDYPRLEIGIQYSLKAGVRKVLRMGYIGSSKRGFVQIVVAQAILGGLLVAHDAQGAVSQNQAVASSQPAANPSSLVPSATKPIDDSSENSDMALDPASLLPDLPALRPQKASLIGGTIDRLDRVRDQLVVQVFGGGKMKITYDPRTHIYRSGAAATASDLRKGDRVYVDTILDGSEVFARNIRVKTGAAAGTSQGVVLSYRSDKGELVLRDLLSPEPLKIRVTSETHLVHDGHPASVADLAQGTLVAVRFDSEKDGHPFARELSVLAAPGSNFTFGGRVAALDLSVGLMVLNSSTDHKTYEIYLDPSIQTNDSLRPGSNVTAVANYDGSRYVARSVTVDAK